MQVLSFDCAVRTDTGHRRNNEDAAFASTRLAAVADGVGGAVAGEVASRTAINALIHLDKCRLARRLDLALRDAVLWGNQTIRFIAGCRPQMAGMSTTLTAAALSNDGTYVLANVGDSRTYLFRDRRLSLLTHDDSLVQDLIDRGEIAIDEARRHPMRSVVLRALDGRTDRDPALTELAARPGDRLLLCSDGLSDVIDHDSIARGLGHRSRVTCANHLVDMALAAGGRDNITVVIADSVPRCNPASAW